MGKIVTAKANQLPVGLVGSSCPQDLAQQLLARSPAFNTCSQTVLNALINIGRAKQVAKGEYVCRSGMPVTRVCMLLDGVLEIARIQSDGHRHLVGLALPGDFISFTGMIDGGAHLHDVLARNDALVMEFNAQELTDLRHQHISLVMACERLLVRRMRLMYDRLAADPAWVLENRLAHILCMCADLFAKKSSLVSTDVDIGLSQTDVADMLGVSRQSVNFALKKMEAEGLVRLHYSRISITNMTALKQLSES
ncbi:Crp/Fnr family transcriptional regulator [Limnohabitans sp. Bal53]|uniref:Crp/Fnr family transcriptional regulator n=1 Tax=Limnohabitans sp. Bal53 TaxID=1977910 RepID=UPI000D38DDBC|nr:Crp/Fnr family transcriptional regulator [Limnohabitans sp. Bal53]PUE39705.1 hypothetical protein B9Z50_13340 [Limnohabitans sp. Bal53]